MTDHNYPLSLDEVLAQIAETADAPDEVMLRAWIAEYPHYARDLIEFATDWIELDAARAPVDFSQADFDSIVNRTMSRAQNLLDADAPADVIDLRAEIPRAGYTFASFQNLIGIDQSVLDCLIARLVKCSTIPASLIDLISDALDRSADSIRMYFRLPPQQALAHKASVRPVLTQCDFRDIIEHANLPAEARLRWLSADPDPKLYVPPDG